MDNIKENKMGVAPILPLILKMSLPAMFSMLIQSLYNVVDSIFVSNYAADALTAVNLAFPLQMLMISVAVGTGVGINSLVSRRLGERNREEASHAATHGIVLAVLSWMLFAVIGILFSRPFFEMYSSNPQVVSMGTSYMSIVTIFSFGSFVEINLEKSLQATGNMIFPMLFQLTGAVINIILDPILIFGFDMGITGAAVATVIGQILAMVFSLIVVFVKNHDVHITFRNFRLRFRTIKDIYAVGFPAIVMQAISSLMIGCMNLILSASQAAVDVLGIYFKLQSFVFMPVFGLTQGLLPVMGYNYGAKNKNRLLSTMKIGCVIAVIIMAMGTVIFMVLPQQLMSIYKYTDDMMRIGTVALKVISLSFLPAALDIVISSFFQAVGAGIRSLIVSVLRQLVVIVPAAYFLFTLGDYAVWYSFPIAEVVSLTASGILFIQLYKKQIKHLSV